MEREQVGPVAPSGDTAPLLPDTTSDERESWGERVSDDADDLRRFLDEVPPHHG